MSNQEPEEMSKSLRKEPSADGTAAASSVAPGAQVSSADVPLAGPASVESTSLQERMEQKRQAAVQGSHGHEARGIES